MSNQRYSDYHLGYYMTLQLKSSSAVSCFFFSNGNMTFQRLLIPTLLPCSFSHAMLSQKDGRKSYAHRPGLKVRLNLNEVPKSSEKMEIQLLYEDSLQSTTASTWGIAELSKLSLSCSVSLWRGRYMWNGCNKMITFCLRCSIRLIRSSSVTQGNVTAPVLALLDHSVSAHGFTLALP